LPKKSRNVGRGRKTGYKEHDLASRRARGGGTKPVGEKGERKRNAEGRSLNQEEKREDREKTRKGWAGAVIAKSILCACRQKAHGYKRRNGGGGKEDIPRLLIAARGDKTDQGWGPGKTLASMANPKKKNE